HHYWDRAEIRRYIEETAARAGRSVEQRFAELAPDDFRDLDELLERFVENLREGRRYILPSLFGYTEEARRAKRSVHVETGRKRRTWTEDEFMTELASTLDRAEAAAVRRISDAAREAVRLPCDFRMMGPRSDALSHRPRSFRTPQANAGRELRLTRRDFWLSPDRTKRR
ncbi:MAG: hypothetical protein WD942_07285, partial [Dehalococcoidia bacterium]